MIKFFFEMYGSPAEEEWGRRDGVISVIRRRMGTSAPSVQMVPGAIVLFLLLLVFFLFL